MALRRLIIGEAVDLLDVGCQIELAPFCYGRCVGNGRRVVAEEGCHLGRRLDVELVVRASFAVGFFERFVVLYSRKRIVKAVTLPNVVVDVVGGREADAEIAA